MEEPFAIESPVRLKDLLTMVPPVNVQLLAPVANAPESPAVAAVQVAPSVETRKVTDAAAELIRYLSMSNETAIALIMPPLSFRY